MSNEDQGDLSPEGASSVRGFEEIVGSRRFALGVREDCYGVWDLRRPDQPLATYPKTDAGFGEAEEHFDRLRRSEPRDRASLTIALRWALIAGLSFWVFAGGIYDVLYAKGAFASEGLSRLATVLLSISMIASRVWVAALVGLAALWLRRAMGDRTEARPD